VVAVLTVVREEGGGLAGAQRSYRVESATERPEWWWSLLAVRRRRGEAKAAASGSGDGVVLPLLQLVV
jgi:hypothetical protein